MGAIKVVIADDHQDTVTVLAMLLNRMFDCEVIVCNDGPSCVAAIREEQPLLALVDLQMPEMSGIAVAAELRQAGISGVFLVALSGYSSTHLQRLCMDAGFDCHELKPISAIRLSELLALAAQRAELRCEADTNRI